MQESFLAGRPFSFIFLFWIIGCIKGHKQITSNITLEKICRVCCSGQRLLHVKANKKKILSGTEAVSMESHIICWLVQNLEALLWS